MFWSEAIGWPTAYFNHSLAQCVLQVGPTPGQCSVGHTVAKRLSTREKIYMFCYWISLGRNLREKHIRAVSQKLRSTEIRSYKQWRKDYVSATKLPGISPSDYPLPFCHGSQMPILAQGCFHIIKQLQRDWSRVSAAYPLLLITCPFVYIFTRTHVREEIKHLVKPDPYCHSVVGLQNICSEREKGGTSYRKCVYLDVVWEKPCRKPTEPEVLISLFLSLWVNNRLIKKEVRDAHSATNHHFLFCGQGCSVEM